ncbi:MAG: tRNA pseudouridine(13) synthase TruD [Geobacter sp.]|nr:MAG: tRNA pseudouridine(13) synthase TruD [Geobacter sp.]
MHPYLTADIPGVGGAIKATPEDFLVEEIPAYEPCGSGEHLYLLIEKRGITTLEALRRVAGALKIPERDIGYAGMKDSAGVTRQTVSVQRIRPEDVTGRELDGVKVLSAVRHTNKLKLGHLKGNRFRIVVRGVAAAAAEAVPAVLALLAKRGVPNYFGAQRYGVQGNSHLIGTAMLQRDWHAAIDCLIGEPEAVRDEQWRAAIQAYHAGDGALALRLMPRHCRSEHDVLQRLATRPEAWEKAFNAVHPKLKKLYLSACQSRLFDALLERRLGEIDRVLAGDLAFKHVNGACFLVEDAELEAPRAAAFEISASGPMFGSKMKNPAGAPLELEQQVLSEAGLMGADFDLGSGLRMEGERRPLRVPLAEPLFSLEADSLVLEFSLPKGSYATSVVREFTKNF